MYSKGNGFEMVPPDWFRQEDTLHIARNLLGKLLSTRIDGQTTAGIITETEAYLGVTDRASHAYGGRRTSRNEPMYATGGIAYVYLCYGIHHLFNIVTANEGNPQAVLIRGIFPVEGIGWMLQRRASKPLKPAHGIGPGNVSKLLGIKTIHSGLPLIELFQNDAIWISDIGLNSETFPILCSERVGVEYAGTDALLPYRFRWDKPDLGHYCLP